MFDSNREPKTTLINAKPGFEVPTIEQIRQWDREYGEKIRSQEPIVCPPGTIELMKRLGYIK